MKRIQQIIIHLFLLGMLLSVMQYIPLSDDTDASVGTELAKKAKEDNSCDDEDEDSDADEKDDLKTDLYASAFDYNTFYLRAMNGFSRDKSLYQSHTSRVSTPPPKA